MKWFRVIVWIRMIAVIGVVLMIMASPVGAEGTASWQDVWQMGQNAWERVAVGEERPVIIPQGNWVQEVLVIGNDAHIYGQVQDEVVVVYGDAYIHSGGRVMDKVVAIGGRVYLEDGALANQGVYSFGADSRVVAGGFLAAGLLILCWFVQLCISVMVMILVPMVASFRKDPVRRMHWRLQESPLSVASLGTGGAVLALLIIGLLSLTIIGIPLAILFALICLCAIIYGMAGLALEVNCWFGNGEWVDESVMSSAFRGSLLLMGWSNIPIAGLCVVAGVMVISLGNVLMLWKKEEE